MLRQLPLYIKKEKKMRNKKMAEREREEEKKEEKRKNHMGKGFENGNQVGKEGIFWDLFFTRLPGF